jgi:hypothetical protein
VLIPGASGPYGIHFSGHVFPHAAIDSLLPKTTIDHLLSEEDRRKAEQERKEFEAVGQAMLLTEENLYPAFYELAIQRVASGGSADEIRREMLILTQVCEIPFASIMREAYEDALAGRPPKFSAPF